jgi:hypothetical protein
MSTLKAYFDSQPEVVNKDLELHTFCLSVRCAPWPFPDELKIQYSNIFYQAIFGIIAEAGIPKSSLSFTSPEKALELNKREGDRTTGWFAIGYKEPGKRFGITVDDEVFQIRCDGILLKDLVALADSVFSRITEAWRSDGLAKPVLLDSRAHTVDYTFEFLIRLGNDKVQQKPVRNYELLTQALSLNRPPQTTGAKSVLDALPSVGCESYVRMDFAQHAIKTIDGKPFNIGFMIEGPFNENNSTLRLLTFLRMEEEFGFDLATGLKWETAFASFLRDIVLKRFFANLLCSTSYSNL